MTGLAAAAAVVDDADDAAERCTNTCPARCVAYLSPQLVRVSQPTSLICGYGAGALGVTANMLRAHWRFLLKKLAC